MSEYYAVIRSMDHLAHYGVKGMKWGVRKAIATGNQKRLDRHFRKAAKKLAKLQNIGLHPSKSYAKAAAYGAAAAGVGTLAIKGTAGIRRAIQNANAKGILDAKNKVKAILTYTGSDAVDMATKKKMITGLMEKQKKLESINKHLDDYDVWTKQSSSIAPIETHFKEVKDKAGKISYAQSHTHGLTKGEALRVGAGLVAAGLGARAAQHLYRARNADKYRNKASEFKNAMDEVFSGTKYAGKYVVPPKERKKRRR